MKNLKTIALAIALLTIANLCFGQSADSIKNKKPLVYAEQMPEFPGGQTALYKYLSDNIKYPDSARIKGIEGRVLVQFIVEADGSVDGIKALRNVGGGCTEEAIRVMKIMPKWKPAKQNSKDVAVAVQMNLPISFQLSDDNNKKKK